MPTCSIFDDIVIDNPKAVERLVEVLEAGERATAERSIDKTIEEKCTRSENFPYDCIDKQGHIIECPFKSLKRMTCDFMGVRHEEGTMQCPTRIYNKCQVDEPLTEEDLRFIEECIDGYENKGLFIHVHGNKNEENTNV